MMVRELLGLVLSGVGLAGALAVLAYLLVALLHVAFLDAVMLDAVLGGLTGVGVYSLKSSWDTLELNIYLQLYLEKLRFSEEASDRLVLRRKELISEALLARYSGARRVVTIGDAVIIKHGGDGE
jgi:hypothetical protein